MLAFCASLVCGRVYRNEKMSSCTHIVGPSPWPPYPVIGILSCTFTIYRSSLSLSLSLFPHPQSTIWYVFVQLNVQTVYRPSIHMSRTLTSKMLHKTNLQVFLWFSECILVVMLLFWLFPLQYTQTVPNIHVSILFLFIALHAMPIDKSIHRTLFVCLCMYAFPLLLWAFASSAIPFFLAFFDLSLSVSRTLPMFIHFSLAFPFCFMSFFTCLFWIRIQKATAFR